MSAVHKRHYRIGRVERDISEGLRGNHPCVVLATLLTRLITLGGFVPSDCLLRK